MKRCEVVDFKAFPPNRNEHRDIFRPIVRITTPGSAIHHVQVSKARYSNPFKIGTKIEVLHSKSDPDDAISNESEQIWGTTQTFAAVGSVFMLIGGVLIAPIRMGIGAGSASALKIERWATPVRLFIRMFG